ncbi:MAG: hypothetical protein ACLPID_21100 [Beijerinckiaceae bacterium]
MVAEYFERFRPENPVPAGTQNVQSNDASPARAPIISDVQRDRVGKSFLQLVDDLISTETGWSDEHKRQHRNIAKLFIKSAGTDDPRRMTQEDIGAFHSLLSRLPKNHDKSPKDKDRTLHEILERGRAAQQAAEKRETEAARRDPAYTPKTVKLCGLEITTVNRYMDELGTILKYCRGNGYPIGDLSALKDFKRADDEDEDEKRSAFDLVECAKLFEANNWRGCSGVKDRVNQGPMMIHDAIYWAPLLGYYSMARLGEILGLMVTDIDSAPPIPSLKLRRNQIRGLKTKKTSKRRLPIHPELLRLGFLEYVAELQNAGHQMLFPELRKRGDKTALSSLFNKEWTKILDHQLPNARSETKTFYSFRHTGNTQLLGVVEDSVRIKLMGHAGTTVNERVYSKEIPDEIKFNALLKLSNVTENLVRFPIQLSPLLDSP